MDELIAPLRNVICYMDDIFVFGESTKNHDEELIVLMNRIRDFGFHLKLQKCTFAFTEIKYLGALINKDRIKTAASKQ